MNKLSTPGSRAAASLDERRLRSAAAAEAITAVAIDGLDISSEAETALNAWERGLVQHVAIVDHPLRDRTRTADHLVARYAALLLRLPDLPLTFDALCLLHHDLFVDLDPTAGRPRKAAISDVDGITLPDTIPSNDSPDIIPDLARLAFNGIAEGEDLLGTDRPTFVARAAEFATDLFIAAPFAVGNGIAVRLLLTALSRAAGHSIAFEGATRSCVYGAFAEAMNGDYAGLIQLLDAAARPTTGAVSAALATRAALLGGDIAPVVQRIAREHNVVFKRAPIDDLTDAASRLAGSEVAFDDTEQLLVALGRAGVLNGRDSVMLHAAHLRQKADAAVVGKHPRLDAHARQNEHHALQSPPETDMSSSFTTATEGEAASPDQRHRREKAVRGGIASAAIEGGAVSPEAKAIMHEWAQGFVSEEDAIERIKALPFLSQEPTPSAAD